MYIYETNLCAYRGGLMIKEGETLDRVKGLLVTAINELKYDGYDPSLIGEIYVLAKAQVETEDFRGMDCDNPDDVADFYDYISDILSVVDAYMEDGIRCHSDTDREISYQIGQLLNLLSKRSSTMRGFGWSEKDDDD